MNLIFASKHTKKIPKGQYVVLSKNFDIIKLHVNNPLYLEINSIMDEIITTEKSNIIKLISSLNKINNNEKWLATSVSSANNLQTDFFEVLIMALTGRFVCNEGLAGSILTDDYRIFQVLMRSISCRISVSSKIQYALSCCAAYCCLIFRFLWARLYFIFKVFLTHILLKKCETLTGERSFIFSWVEARCFKNGHFREQYLTGLDKLDLKIKPVLLISYYTNPLLFRKMYSSGLNFAALHQYFSFKYFLGSLFTTPLESSLINSFLGMDIHFLLKIEINRECGKASYLFNILEYYCWLSFFKQSSGLLVYPFENQSWERLMLLARSRSLLYEFRLVGYQHSSIGTNLLTYWAGFNLEKNEGLFPDLLVANNSNNADLLKRSLHPNCAVINGGALRFIKQRKNAQRQSFRNKVIIGVFLPIIKDQALELFAHINQNKKDFNFLIKSHPNTDLSKLKINDNASHFRGDASELLDLVDGIVYCSSSVGFEAFFQGVPAFRFEGNFIDLKMAENLFTPKTIAKISDISKESLKVNDRVHLDFQPRWDFWTDLLTTMKVQF